MRLRRWLAGLAVLVGGAGAACAQEGVLNSPVETVKVVKTVVDTAKPQYESLWLWSEGTWSQGVSASLWTFHAQQIPVADLRLGYGTGEVLYTGLGLDLPGLSRRFIPAQIKGMATAAPLDLLWSAVGRYARVGVVTGYNFHEKRMELGATFGASLNF